jgi:hypothetical protein
MSLSLSLPLLKQQNQNFQKSRNVIKNTLFRNDGSRKVLNEDSVLEKDLKSIIALYPDPKTFLGEDFVPYTPKKRFQFMNKKLPDLTIYQEAVSEQRPELNLFQIRSMIAKLNKKYVDFADVRALQAIQIFNDISHSGLDSDKLLTYKKSLLIMTKVLFSGGTSIFNVTWFIRIYLKYLEVLNCKIQSRCKTASRHSNVKIKNLAKTAYKRQMQILSLLSAQNRLDGLRQLNMKMKNTIFIKKGINQREIASACRAIAENDDNRIISEGKKAIHIIRVTMTLNLLFSKIPILRDLVEDNLSIIPDSTRDFVLQKSMLYSNHQLMDFRLAFACGNKVLARSIALKLFKFNNRLINRRLSMCLITRAFELDPFLKIIWIVTESNGLLTDSDYHKMVTEALKCIQITRSERCQVKGYQEPIDHLNLSLNNIKSSYAWG